MARHALPVRRSPALVLESAMASGGGLPAYANNFRSLAEVNEH